MIQPNTRQDSVGSAAYLPGIPAGGAGDILEVLAATLEVDVDLEDVKNMQATINSGGTSFYKLNANGESRFRVILHPKESPRNPLRRAHQHYIEYSDGASTVKRGLNCLGLFDIECPLCRLASLLQKSNDPQLKKWGGLWAAKPRFAMLVIDRNYLLPDGALYDPSQETEIKLAHIAQSAGKEILELMGQKWYGNPARLAPSGYDIHVTGGKDTNNFTRYKVIPVPKEHSPTYDPNLLANINTLESRVRPPKLEDLKKTVEALIFIVGTNPHPEGMGIAQLTRNEWNVLYPELEAAYAPSVSYTEPAPVASPVMHAAPTSVRANPEFNEEMGVTPNVQTQAASPTQHAQAQNSQGTGQPHSPSATEVRGPGQEGNVNAVPGTVPAPAAPSVSTGNVPGAAVQSNPFDEVATGTSSNTNVSNVPFDADPEPVPAAQARQAEPAIVETPTVAPEVQVAPPAQVAPTTTPAQMDAMPDTIQTAPQTVPPIVDDAGVNKFATPASNARAEELKRKLQGISAT